MQNLKLKMKNFFLFLFVLLVSTYQPINLSTYELNLTETKLATIPLDYQEVSNIVFSANGKRVAYKSRKADKEFVVVGDTPGKPYEEAAHQLLLSPDGQRVAYQAIRGEKQYLVLDGKESKPYDEVSPALFSPDGKLVCEVKEGGKWFISVGDKESPRYDMSNTGPLLSPDGRLIFYVLQDYEKGKFIAFLSDTATMKVKKAIVSDLIGTAAFSADGSWWAYYPIEKEGKVFLLLNNLALNEEKEVPLVYGWVGGFTLSAKGQHLAYTVRKEGGQFVVVSNWDSPAKVKENGPYDEVGKPVFSPDGKKIAYPASKDGKWFVVSGEWEGPAYDMVVTPIFSPDGSRLIYRARRGENQRFIVIADANTGSVLREGLVCDEVWEPVISPDGKFVCYGARIGKELWWKNYPVR